MVLARAVDALVVDCSVLVKWELPDEDFADQAMELLHDWQAGAVAVHSPDLLPSEIGSVFLRALRQGRMTEAQARAGMGNLLRAPYVLHPSSPLVVRAFEIAQQHNQRIYDCFYVALAEREMAECWTSDERLYNALHAQFPFVRFIAQYMPRR